METPLITIVIPNYIREIKISNSRRAIYYKLDKGIITSTATIKKRMLTDEAKEFLAKHPTASITPVMLNAQYTIGVITPKGLVDYVINKETMMTAKGRILGMVKPSTKLLVIDLTTNESVIANVKVVGQPKFKLINGQDIYNGGVNEHLRAFMMREIKLDMSQHIISLPIIINYPVFLEMEIHDVIGKGDWDIENRAMPYMKAFSDLVRSGIIKDGKKEIKLFNPIIKDDNISFLTKSGGATFYPIEDTADRKLIFKFYRDNRPEITNHPYYKLK